jgi:hypothetical protein
MLYLLRLVLWIYISSTGELSFILSTTGLISFNLIFSFIDKITPHGKTKQRRIYIRVYIVPISGYNFGTNLFKFPSFYTGPIMCQRFHKHLFTLVMLSILAHFASNWLCELVLVSHDMPLLLKTRLFLFLWRNAHACRWEAGSVGRRSEGLIQNIL